MQGAREVLAHHAAQAAVAELHDLVGTGLDEQMVEPDRAELVDDDGGVLHVLAPENAPQERRLAAAEKAGEDRDRQRVAVRRHRCHRRYLRARRGADYYAAEPVSAKSPPALGRSGVELSR